MNEDRFWDIVAEVDWPTLSKKSRGYEEGKQLLLGKFPRLEDLNEFQDEYTEKYNSLYKALEEWEKEGAEGYGWDAHNPRNFGLGDDSFGDLIAHIIGMGREHYEAVLVNPELAHKRAMSGDFVESFAYCVPYSFDYVPPESKLEVAMDGLNYWIELAARADAHDFAPNFAMNETETRIMEVAKLRSLVEGREMTPEEVSQMVREIEVEVQEKLEAELLTRHHELETELKTVQGSLKTVQGSLKAVRDKILSLKSK